MSYRRTVCGYRRRQPVHANVQIEKGPSWQPENPASELQRLFKAQDKALEDEVFGGLSPAERAQYDRTIKRINELAIELAASTVAKKNSQSAKAQRKRQWNKESETDTHQAAFRQAYRSREKDLTDPSTTSRRKRQKAKNMPDQKDSGD